MYSYRPPQGMSYYHAPAPWSGNTHNSYEYQGYPYLRNNPQHLHHPSYLSGPSPYQSRNHVQQQPYYYVQSQHFPHHGQYMHGPQDQLPMQQMSASGYQPAHQSPQDHYHRGGQQQCVGNHLNNNDGISTSRQFQKNMQQQQHEYTRYNQVKGEGLTSVNGDDNFQKDMEEQCTYNEKIQDSNSQIKISLKSENIMTIKIDNNHQESIKSNENSKESNNHKEKCNTINQKETNYDNDQDHCGSLCRDSGQIKHKIEEINQSEEVHLNEKLQENINTNTILLFKSSPKNNQTVSAPENLKIPLKYLQSEQNPKILQNISKKTVIEKKCKISNNLNGNSIAGASFKAKYLSQQKTPLLHRRKIRSMKYLLDIQKQQQELQMQQQNEEGHKNPFFLESKIKYPRISVPCRKIPNSINPKVSQVFKGCFKHKCECIIQGGNGQLSSYVKQQNNLEEEYCSLNTPSTLNVANESGNTLAAQREQYNLFLAQQDTIHRNIAFCKIKTKKILKRKQELTQYIENYKAMLEIKAIRQYLLSLSLSDFMWNFLRFLEVQMKTNQKDFNDFKIQLLQLESESPNIFMNWIIQNEQISSYFVSFLTAPLDKFIKTEDQSQVHQIISSFIQKTVHDISCEPTSPVTIESEENEQVISEELA